MKDQKAYLAMYHFLEERYKRLPSDSLGQLLSEMNLHIWDDGEPADPAIADNWDRAVFLAEQNPVTLAEDTALLLKAS